MKLFKIILILSTSFYSLKAIAQEKEDATEVSYSYKSDKVFYKDTDLYGYTFIPNESKHNFEEKSLIKAGDVRIHITANYCYFRGVSGLKDFNIVSINTTQDGFKFDLMDSRNPTFRGEVEIFINEKKQCEGLLFYSKSLGQYAFYLPEQNDKLREKDLAYFTIKQDYKVTQYSDVVGTTIRPFMKIDNPYENLEYEKIREKDSVKIVFEERFVILYRDGNGKSFEIKSETTLDAREQHADLDIARIIELAWKQDKKYKIRLYLTPKNEVNMLEFGATQYFLINR